MTTPEIAYISLGSNINPETNLRQAVALLREHCEVLAISSVYQSPAYGFENQPDFLDITVKVSTSLTPEAFKSQVLDEIERRCGRDRASQINKDGPLPLDIDILLWGDAAFDYGSKPWRVPHKGILKFAAVAIPLAEIAPAVMHPTEKVSLAEIAARFDDAASVQKLPWRIE